MDTKVITRVKKLIGAKQRVRKYGKTRRNNINKKMVGAIRPFFYILFIYFFAK